MKTPPRHRLAQYGLTVEDWQTLLAHQGYACGICRRPFKDGRVPHTDHDHRDGLCRGLLDMRCNRDLLGVHGDQVALYQGAVAYLLNPPAYVLGPPYRRHRDAPPSKESE